MTQALAHDHADDEIEDHDRGLVFDLTTLDRRRVLKLLWIRRPEREPVHDHRVRTRRRDWSAVGVIECDRRRRRFRRELRGHS